MGFIFFRSEYWKSLCRLLKGGFEGIIVLGGLAVLVSNFFLGMKFYNSSYTIASFILVANWGVFAFFLLSINLYKRPIFKVIFEISYWSLLLIINVFAFIYATSYAEAIHWNEFFFIHPVDYFIVLFGLWGGLNIAVALGAAKNHLSAYFIAIIYMGGWTFLPLFVREFQYWQVFWWGPALLSSNIFIVWKYYRFRVY